MTTTLPAQSDGKRRRWRSSAVGSVICSPDFYIGYPLGLACGVIPAVSTAVAAATQTVLLGVSAVAGALVALVLTAVAVLVGAITPALGEFIDRTPNGLKGLMRPYQIVIGVAAVSCGLSLVAALAWPWIQSLWWMRLFGVGLPVGALLWSLGGCMQIVNLTLKIINQGRAVERLQARRDQLKSAGKHPKAPV